jgi:molybdopterin molybdotransferase
VDASLTRVALEEAIARAVACARPLGIERVPLAACIGRVLARSVNHPHDLPGFDHAAMDGYAIAGGAKAGAAFVVQGESRAGAPSEPTIEADHAAAISTGAMLPAGLDTVVPWEDVERTDARITLRRDARGGQHVRRAGEDAQRGERAIDAGVRLAPGHLALLATLDRIEVEVHARPRVTIVTTGDELRDPGSPPRPGAVVDSNAPMLAALVGRAGGRTEVRRVADTEGALAEALGAVADTCDLIVTVGGAADGAHDHVQRALDARAAERVFRGVAIKPGKPVALARIGALPVLALPGNPGSAFVTFACIGLPLVRALGGEAEPVRGRRRVRLAAPLRAPGDRTALVLGTVEELPSARFVPGRAASSGSVPSVARATALALVEAGTTRAEGDEVAVIDLARA